MSRNSKLVRTALRRSMMISSIALISSGVLAAEEEAGSRTEAEETGSQQQEEGAPQTGESDVDAVDQASSGQTPVNQASGLEAIVVTAQKREQNLNDVAMSVSTLSGDQLSQRGIEDPSSLMKVVPGFSYTETQFGAPIYTLRGVGYSESSLAASPTVSVYVDEVPLPYPVMAGGAIFDLDRVEVLKGPQGTLFGQNSTGGAISYIAAKPTRYFEADSEASYGRFNTVDLSGYVSGPLSDKVAARVAFKTTQSGPWQESVTRSDDHGEKDFTTARVIVDVAPTEDLEFSFNLNGWSDQSDTQIPQLSGIFQAVPGPLDPRVANAPLATGDARQADWDPGLAFERDNRFYQGSLRADWDFMSDVTLTSITAFQRFDRDALQEADGTIATDLHIGTGGHISSFSEEMRVGGAAGDRLNWMVGANYAKDSIVDTQQVFLGDSSGANVLGLHFDSVKNFSDQEVESWAVFANGEFEILDQLSVEAGVRYTDTEIQFSGCSLDSGAGDLSTIFGVIQGFIPAPTVAPLAGACITLLPDFNTGLINDSLAEDNVSWRAGVNWKPTDDSLLYANVSQGFKAGSFPTLSASSFAQFKPVVQEELLAYEAGFKLSLAERTAQLNGSIFHYDYTNKQFGGRILDPIFGQLSALVNIPESTVDGAELQAIWAPVEGLTFNTAATYIDTEIGAFVDFDQFGTQQSFEGNRFPYSPKWQVSADAEYRWGVAYGLEAFVGGDLVYRSATKGGIENDARLAIDSYAVVDLRAGVEDESGIWRFSVWAQNVTDEYYWNNVLHTQDTIIRYASTPATYGLSLSYKFQ